MFSINEKLSVFGSVAQTKPPQLGNSVRDTRFTGSLFTNPEMQQKVEQGFRNKVNWVYSTISQLAEQSIVALHAPIKAMSELRLPRLEITHDRSSGLQSLRNFANKMISYHENVIKTIEKTSRIAGNRAYAFFRLALTPIRFFAKILRIESAGVFIQHSIALAAGFVARSIVMTTMPLGHILPYVISGGIGIAIGILAIKVSSLAAFGVTLGLVLIGKQAQIIAPDKKVEASKYQPIHTDKMKGRKTTKTVLGMLGATGILGYFYSSDAVGYIGSIDVQQISNFLFKNHPDLTLAVAHIFTIWLVCVVSEYSSQLCQRPHKDPESQTN
jgi:hypothetical protein